MTDRAADRLRGRWQRWWQKPRQRFRAQSREADRLEASGSSDAAVTLRLNAITAFVRKADVDLLLKYASDIQWNLMLAAARRPSGAVAAFAELDRLCPQCISRKMTLSVVREWARSPRLDSFEDDWVMIDMVLSGRRQDSLKVLLDACRGVSCDQLTETFRHGATTYLWAYLDHNLQLATPAGEQVLGGQCSAFHLLDLVEHRNLSRADQLCALGDLAITRASPWEALRRYEAAFKLGSIQAAPRLAYHHAQEGHRLLSAGNITAARRKFVDAWRLHQDQEYALLCAIADLLSDNANTRVVLDQLEDLDRTGASMPYVTFWRAIAHLRRGEQDEAMALLHGFERQHSDGNQPWGPVEEGTVLLAVLEGNDDVLVDQGRRLVRTYGRRWLSAGPTDPWPMVAAVARRDPALLAEMVTLIDNSKELPEWVRVVGAHALLTKGVESALRGLTSEAATDIGSAERLLRDEG